MKLIIDIDEGKILNEFVGYDVDWLMDDKIEAIEDADFFA